MPPKIAYVMSRFPHLPETFILREMIALEQMRSETDNTQSWEIALYPLIYQKQAVIHPEARPWLERVRWTPFLSLPVLRNNSHLIFRRPRAYAGLWAQVLRENRSSPNFLLRSAAILPQAVWMSRAMKKENVSHVHAHYGSHPALMAWLIHRLTGLSYSVTVHAHDIFVRTAMLSTKLRSASFIIAISEYNRQYLTSLLGEWIQPKIHVIHCGIEPHLYQPRPPALERSSPFRILSIGSLQPYKGQTFLIQACQHLVERGIPFHCQVIGGGEQRSKLEKQINTLGLADHVELTGPLVQSRVAELLSQADCYVQPSIITATGKMEGIPVSLMEALACQVPCIATSISGIPELIQPGKTGYLVPPGDAHALADAMIEVYQQPAAASNLAAAGRSLVLKEFELQANVQQLAALFRTVTGG